MIIPGLVRGKKKTLCFFAIKRWIFQESHTLDENNHHPGSVDPDENHPNQLKEGPPLFRMVISAIQGKVWPQDIILDGKSRPIFSQQKIPVSEQIRKQNPSFLPLFSFWHCWQPPFLRKNTHKRPTNPCKSQATGTMAPLRFCSFKSMAQRRWKLWLSQGEWSASASWGMTGSWLPWLTRIPMKLLGFATVGWLETVNTSSPKWCFNGDKSPDRKSKITLNKQKGSASLFIVIPNNQLSVLYSLMWGVRQRTAQLRK